PSSRATISATAGPLWPSNSNRASARRARSTNRVTASDPPTPAGSPGPGSDSGASRYRASPATASGSPPVASTPPSPPPPNPPPPHPAPAPTPSHTFPPPTTSRGGAPPPPPRPPRPPPRPPPPPQPRRDHRADLRPIPHRRQLHQPHPIGEPARHRPGHLTRQPGLARPPRPGHRHQAALTQQSCDLLHRRRPADKTGQHGRATMHPSRRHDRGLPHPRT